MPTDDGDFEWWSDGTVVVRTQMAVAVYRNQHGDIIVRQEGQYHPSEDVYVLIAPENVQAVAQAMLELIANVTPAVTAKIQRPVTDSAGAVTGTVTSRLASVTVTPRMAVYCD